MNLPSDGQPTTEALVTDRPTGAEESLPWRAPDVRPLRRIGRDRPAPPRLVVASDTSWFQLQDRELVRIETRAPLRRLLGGLVELRLFRPTATMSVIEAFAAGWPGERAHPNAASIRVYTAIHTIRHLGLRSVLLRRNGGYILEAEVELSNADGNNLPEPERIAV